MNTEKEKFVRKECYRAAVQIYCVLLRNRNAKEWAEARSINEIYSIALGLQMHGKQFWSDANIGMKVLSPEEIEAEAKGE